MPADKTRKQLLEMLRKEFEKDKFNHVGANDFADQSKQLGYAEMIHCSNCAWFTTVYIPFGSKKKEYLKEKSCERCKCEGTIY